MFHHLERGGFVDDRPYMTNAAAYHERYQQRIAKSRNLPFRWFAIINTIIYIASAIGLGAFANLVSRAKPSALHRALGEEYAYVPEMAIHKAIELEAYLETAYKGTGVDFGAGSGIVGGLLMKHAGFDGLHGVDAWSQEEIARGHGYTGYTEASVDNIPMPDDVFDFAICVCVIEHVENLHGVLNEAYRLIKAGGQFVFSTPRPEFRYAVPYYRLLRFFGLNQKAELFAQAEDKRNMHYHFFTADQWRDVLCASGFSDVEIRPIFSRRQFAIYDAINYNVRFPLVYANEILSIWVVRSPRLKAVLSWATAQIASWTSSMKVTEANATHHIIVAKKIGS